MNTKITGIVGAISVAAAVSGFAGAAQALSFVNNSFEADATSGFQSVDPSGWTTFRTGAPPYLINNNTYGNTPYGNQFLAIGGIEDGGTSYIEQTVSGFVPGHTYTLSWAQSSEFTSSDNLEVSFVSGSSTASQIFTSVPYPGGTQFWYTWQNESMSFVANASSVDFHFQEAYDPSSPTYEVGVDNFQISGGVPEPSTWAMMIFGMGGLGVVLRRRREGVLAAA